MSILIKGMKMPKAKECFVVAITDDGAFVMSETDGKIIYDAIEIPDGHGRLIDADALRDSFRESVNECHQWANEIPSETEMYARVSQALGTFVECSLRTKSAPTIIPSDKDGET